MGQKQHSFSPRTYDLVDPPGLLLADLQFVYGGPDHRLAEPLLKLPLGKHVDFGAFVASTVLCSQIKFRSLTEMSTTVESLA